MRRTIPKVEGYTKIETLSFMKMKLKVDAHWAVKACLAIFNQQTQDEKKKHRSIAGHNGCGFSRHDAPLLSAIACRVNQHRQTLEDVQILQIYMEKYAAQLVCLAEQKDKCKNLKMHLDKYYGKKELPF